MVLRKLEILGACFCIKDKNSVSKYRDFQSFIFMQLIKLRFQYIETNRKVFKEIIFYLIMKKNELILFIGGVSFLALIALTILLLGDRFSVQDCGCPKVVSHNLIFIFIFLAIIFVACLFYYFFSLKIEKKERIISKNMEVLNSILDKSEKNVLDLIVKNNGKVEQSVISKKYNKLKAHRILKKLQEKNILDIKKEGKTNKVILKKELREELVR